MPRRKKTKADTLAREQIEARFAERGEPVPTTRDFIDANMNRTLQDVTSGVSTYDGEMNILNSLVWCLTKQGPDDRIHYRINKIRDYVSALHQMTSLRQGGVEGLEAAFDQMAKDAKVEGFNLGDPRELDWWLDNEMARLTTRKH